MKIDFNIVQYDNLEIILHEPKNRTKRSNVRKPYKRKKGIVK